MRLAAGALCRSGASASLRSRGFTLIELLVVLIVIGVVVASIQLNLFSDDARRLRTEGERLAALLTALADETVTSGAPLAVSFSADGYAFWERQDEVQADSLPTQNRAVLWRARPGDELFAGRRMQDGISIVEVRVRQRVLARSEAQPERVIFSPSGLHQPFSVLLALGDLRVRVVSDAIGNLRVEDDADPDNEADAGS
jgi:type II secretion system protein H